MNREITTSKMNGTTAKRIEKILTVCMVVAAMMCMMCMTVFATKTGTTTGTAAGAAAGGVTNFQEGVTTGAHELYKVMTAVVMPIGAVLFAWYAFKVFFGGEKDMDSAKKGLLRIVIIMALVYFAPVVIEQINGWFADGAGDTAVWGNSAD